jgi:hypothetical protein
MFNWCKRMFGSSTDLVLAESRVQEAIDEVDAVVEECQQSLAYSRQQLQHLMSSAAPSRSKVVQVVNRIKHLQTQISEKERVRSNILREKQQLSDTSTNAMVSSAFAQSHTAQMQIQKNGIGSVELDNLLDDVEENRTETREVTDRLGGLGGLDEDALQIDEQSITASDITMAIGLSNEKDRVMREAQSHISDPLVDDVRSILMAMDVPEQAQSYELPAVPVPHSTSRGLYG